MTKVVKNPSQGRWPQPPQNELLVLHSISIERQWRVFSDSARQNHPFLLFLVFSARLLNHVISPSVGVS